MIVKLKKPSRKKLEKNGWKPQGTDAVRDVFSKKIGDIILRVVADEDEETFTYSDFWNCPVLTPTDIITIGQELKKIGGK